jgi:hypothetical protein
MPFKIGKALGYAILIWVTGFIWGSIVFMTPSLKSVAPIPYVSSNPAISFPLLVVWPLLVYLLARSFLKTAADTASQGLRLGLTFSVVNFVLDLVVLVFLLKAGFGYFGSITVWLAYGLLLIVPWLTARSLEKAAAR